MEEILFHGKKISRFTRHAPTHLVSVPTYLTDFFKSSDPKEKKPYINPLSSLIDDDDVTFRADGNTYSITLFAKNRKIARKMYSEVAHLIGVSITSEAVTLQGDLQTLINAIYYLHDDLHCISQEKFYELCNTIDEYLDDDADSESSESDSSTSESPRQLSPCSHSPNNSPRHN